MEKEINRKNFFDQYPTFKDEGLEGRFLSFPELLSRLEKLKKHFEIKETGRSFLNVPIHSIRIGKGRIKILAWSQMHGNETTTTRGALDLLNLFLKNPEDPAVEMILNECTLVLIPMLNPDGAARYTRENANKTDLNRDANNQQEPESRVLMESYREFQPHFCFNLHDQRTIFGAGEKKIPATLSFLAPSMDEERTVNASRKKAMQVIIAMNEQLQELIPGHIGRFDDSFNINCTGDTFQALGVPTILFEAGHFANDYHRLQTRKYFCFSFFVALQSIATGKFMDLDPADYYSIPENRKSFYDVILRNAGVGGHLSDVGIQYREIVKGRQVHFEPVVQAIERDLEQYGHREIDCKGGKVSAASGEELHENDVADSILLNNKKLSIKTH